MSQDPSPSRSIVSLGPRQQAAVAAALTLLSVAVLAAAALGSAWLVTLFLRRFSGVFLPLAVGAVAALVFHPYYHWLRTRLRLPAGAAVAAVCLSILLPCVALAWLFGSLLVEQAAQMISRFPEWWSGAIEQLEGRWPAAREFLRSSPWGQRLRDLLAGREAVLLRGLSAVGGRAMEAGADLFRAVAALFGWVLLPVYFAFFLTVEWKPAAKLDAVLPFLKPETRKDASFLVQQFTGIIVSFFRGQLIVAAAQALLYAVGFSAIGLRYGFALGLALGFLNLIPYLGSVIGLGIGLPLAYFQAGGSAGLAGLVLVVFAAVQTIEAYVLTPRIMGQRTGLHPLAIIVAVLFWGSALQGLLGLILAIPLTAFFVVVWRLLREKYIVELV